MVSATLHELHCYRHGSYVGDPVVVIVAETFEQAVDAAELVYIDYDYLPQSLTQKRPLTKH